MISRGTILPYIYIYIYIGDYFIIQERGTPIKQPETVATTKQITAKGAVEDVRRFFNGRMTPAEDSSGRSRGNAIV